MPARLARLPYPDDSAALFASIRQLPWPVLLDSAQPRSGRGRYDILAAAPYRTLVTRGGITEIREGESCRSSTDDPFDLLRGELACTPCEQAGELPFCGGAIGYFAYDLARRIERLPEFTVDDDAMPEMAVGLYDWAVVVDHHQRAAWLVGQGRDPATELGWDERLRLLKTGEGFTSAPFRRLSPVVSNLNRTEYDAAFQRIQEYIRAGDCYQVNFAQRFQARVEGSPWHAYKRLREVNPAPYCAYLQFPQGTVLSSSPEQFLRLRQGRVTTSPIKGTMPRERNRQRDRQQAERLQASEKDRAENLMIVDLLRNDIGKVCRTGSIKVTRLFDIASFARVHHLVSSVEGELDEGEDALSLLRACFPGGSITGAPKLRAMQIIEELEGYRRGVYCGAIGYVGFDGAMETNIAIRTLVMQEGRISFWAGGGVVADSSADAEYQETLDKAAALFELLD